MVVVIALSLVPIRGDVSDVLGPYFLISCVVFGWFFGVFGRGEVSVGDAICVGGDYCFSRGVASVGHLFCCVVGGK